MLPGIALVVGVDGTAPKLKPALPLLDIAFELVEAWDAPNKNGCGSVLGAVVGATVVVVEDFPKVKGDDGAGWLFEEADVSKAPNTLLLLFVGAVVVDDVELLEPNMNGVLLILLLGFSIFDDELLEPKPFPKKAVCGAGVSLAKPALLLLAVLPNPFPNKPPPDELLALFVFEKKDCAGAAAVVVGFCVGGAIWLDDLENPNWKRLGFDVLFEIEPVENEVGILLLFVVSFFWASVCFTNGLDKNDGVVVLTLELFVWAFVFEPNVNGLDVVDWVASCLIELPKNEELGGWADGTIDVLSDFTSCCGVGAEKDGIVDPKLNVDVSGLEEEIENPFELLLVTFAKITIKKS